jgi:hypothetical protein
MPLPKINHPIFEVYLKSLNRSVKFRPFLVKEEKILLMAKESDNLEDVTKAIKQIISNCLLEEIDVDALPTFDIEMFFVNLRIQSVSETSAMVYTCNNIVNPENEESKDCGAKIDFNLDLRNVKYVEDAGHSNIVKLSETAGMKFNYPTLSFSSSSLDDEFADSGYKFVSEYLDYIYDSEEIHKKSDISEEELQEFFDNLTMDQMKAIRNFFTTSPKVVMEQDVKCPKCGYLHHLNVEGLLNFFD